MAQIPHPLTAELSVEYKKKSYPIDTADMKSQIFELIRKLYEDKVGGLNLGDVFRVRGQTIILQPNSEMAIQKTSDNELGLRLDGSGLEQSSDGLKLGQSNHIDDVDDSWNIDGVDKVNPTTLLGHLNTVADKINDVLGVLEERGLMAAS